MDADAGDGDGSDDRHGDGGGRRIGGSSHQHQCLAWSSEDAGRGGRLRRGHLVSATITTVTGETPPRVSLGVSLDIPVLHLTQNSPIEVGCFDGSWGGWAGRLICIEFIFGTMNSSGSGGESDREQFFIASRATLVLYCGCCSQTTAGIEYDDDGNSDLGKLTKTVFKVLIRIRVEICEFDPFSANVNFNMPMEE